MAHQTNTTTWQQAGYFCEWSTVVMILLSYTSVSNLHEQRAFPKLINLRCLIVQLWQMKPGMITWVCTNSPTASNTPCDCKSCVWMPNYLNNLEPVISHQEIEGAAQSDYSQFHLPQLYVPNILVAQLFLL